MLTLKNKIRESELSLIADIDRFRCRLSALKKVTDNLKTFILLAGAFLVGVKLARGPSIKIFAYFKKYFSIFFPILSSFYRSQ